MGELASIGAAVLWAAASLMFAHLGHLVRPAALNLLKCSIALALMVVTQAILAGTLPAASAHQIGLLSTSGIIGLTLGDTAYFAALTRLGARKTLLFAALTPFVTAVLGHLFLSEAISPMMVVGMAVTVGGVLWVVLERSQADRTRDFGLGMTFALVAVGCQASGSILTKLGTADLATLEVSIIRLLAGSLGLLFVVTGRQQWADVRQALTSRDRLVRLVVALFLGTYLGVWLMNTGLKYTYAGVAATLTSTSPIWVLPMARWFNKEPISLRSWVGATIAVVGVALLFFGR